MPVRGACLARCEAERGEDRIKDGGNSIDR